MRRARTLTEAALFVNLSAGDVEPELTEGAEAWTMTAGEIEVEIPYAGEAEARRTGERFGFGLSELIDAGQWYLIALEYARRAVHDDLGVAAGEDDRADDARLNWEYARDATMEVVKFLPPGAGEVPAGAFWTSEGRQAWQEDPARFTGERLADDVAFYQENLDELSA
ncbi:hypothetical protein MTP10_07380 [Nonomuraea sp. 3-1Str]|uniref:hypothetical protein n=1 Tax=Nonomuraea sp. 3-1Str TaxID=2929801 RepID=UPI00286603D1|nr:hypothetical protein [Nonomuraea sp. 3-1Str]MDR8408555.1 hypothetical protein [Nonomuraea sp. 3-1Str]